MDLSSQQIAHRLRQGDDVPLGVMVEHEYEFLRVRASFANLDPGWNVQWCSDAQLRKHRAQELAQQCRLRASRDIVGTPLAEAMLGNGRRPSVEVLAKSGERVSTLQMYHLAPQVTDVCAGSDTCIVGYHNAVAMPREKRISLLHPDTKGAAERSRVAAEPGPPVFGDDTAEVGGKEHAAVGHI